MKRVISVLLLITLLLASVIAMIPASAATPEEYNLMGNSEKNIQWAGEGNVFYYDYHKYLALGYTFPMTDYGNTAYMIRYPYSGTGSASVSDGVKTSEGVEHSSPTSSGRYIIDPTNQTGVDANGNALTGACYNQIFGYSFKESVVADGIKFYLPANSSITSIDVYGGSVDVANNIFAKETEKTLLASFENVNANATTSVTDDGKDPVDVIVIESELNEALKLDYIFIGVNLSSVSTFYIYEIELNGILASDAADFSELKEQYAIYKGLSEEDWTTETWAALENALLVSDPINKNATSTATEIASAAATLKTAINALEARPVDKTALIAAIAEANELVKEDYTPDSWAIFEDALSAANVANGTEGLSQTEVNDAIEALRAAIEALTAPADKSDLIATLESINSLKESDYTPDSWAALQTPIAKATAVKNDVSATQDDVDAALGALTMAINDLAKPGNKTALKSAITSAKALKKSDYNVVSATWSVFQACIEEAEAVLADENATQGDIDLVLEELTEKIEGLGSPVKNNNSNNKKDDDEELEEDEDLDIEEEEEDATSAPATQAPIIQAPATQAATPKKGCGSSVALSALAIVGAIGSALVIKKKD